MKRITAFLALLIPVLVFSQSAQDITKEKERYAFGQIYTGYRYGFKDSYKPQPAFEFNQGIIGYFHQIAPQVSGKIMFDVTRTTNISSITDSTGNPMTVAPASTSSPCREKRRGISRRWEAS